MRNVKEVTVVQPLVATICSEHVRDPKVVRTSGVNSWNSGRKARDGGQYGCWSAWDGCGFLSHGSCGSIRRARAGCGCWSRRGDRCSESVSEGQGGWCTQDIGCRNVWGSSEVVILGVHILSKKTVINLKRSIYQRLKVSMILSEQDGRFTCAGVAAIQCAKQLSCGYSVCQAAEWPLQCRGPNCSAYFSQGLDGISGRGDNSAIKYSPRSAIVFMSAGQEKLGSITSIGRG